MWDTYKIDKIKKSVLRRMEALPQTTDDETALYIKQLSKINETPISDDTYNAFFPELYQTRRQEITNTNPFWQPSMKRAAYTFSLFTVEAESNPGKDHRHKSIQLGQDRGKYVKLYPEGIHVFRQLNTWSRSFFALILLFQFENSDWPSGLISLSFAELGRQMENNIRRINCLRQFPEMKQNGYLYGSKIMDSISFPVNFFPHNTYKRGLAELEDIRISSCNDKLVKEKLFFATNRKDLYYINPRLFFRGDRHKYLQKLEKGDKWKKTLMELWDDSDISVEEYIRICDEVSFIPNITQKEVEEISASDDIQGEDNTSKYIKIYREGILPICRLNRAGMAVLTDVFYKLLMQFQNSDLVSLSVFDDTFKVTSKNLGSKSEEIQRSNFFYLGLKSCIKNGLICKTAKNELYYINPCFFFYGNRENIITQGKEDSQISF